MAPRPKRSSKSRAAALKAASEAAAAPPKARRPRRAAVAVAAVTPSPVPTSAEETRRIVIRAAVPAPVVEERSTRRRISLLLAAAAVLLLAVIGFAGGRMLGGPDDGLDGVVVGEPRGGVFGSTPEPTQRPTPEPTTSPTPEATLEPTATLAPITVATPIPATPAPAPVTPAPTPVMVAMAVTPDQTVATWYSYVVNGEFDAAYALWSDRMKANFPRASNLDNRWAATADVSVLQIYVTNQTANHANVYIDFIETKDDGSSRRFIGSWDLVRSGDAWLLDQPHF